MLQLVVNFQQGQKNLGPLNLAHTTFTPVLNHNTFIHSFTSQNKLQGLLKKKKRQIALDEIKLIPELGSNMSGIFKLPEHNFH